MPSTNDRGPTIDSDQQGCGEGTYCLSLVPAFDIPPSLSVFSRHRGSYRAHPHSPHLPAESRRISLPSLVVRAMTSLYCDIERPSDCRHQVRRADRPSPCNRSIQPGQTQAHTAHRRHRALAPLLRARTPPARGHSPSPLGRVIDRHGQALAGRARSVGRRPSRASGGWFHDSSVDAMARVTPGGGVAERLLSTTARRGGAHEPIDDRHALRHASVAEKHPLANTIASRAFQIPRYCGSLRSQPAGYVSAGHEAGLWLQNLRQCQWHS